jgi:hypothetical protein
MRSKNAQRQIHKRRRQIDIGICINHATSDEREYIRYAIEQALTEIRPEWVTFNSVRVTDHGWLN